MVPEHEILSSIFQQFLLPFCFENHIFSLCSVLYFTLMLIVSLFSVEVISNSGGELSANYPSHLIILEYEHPSTNVSGNLCPLEPARTTGTIYESMHDATKLRELFGKSRFARCRARFPLPVILYRGKHICRCDLFYLISMKDFFFFLE
jgi:hypothetical protein